MNDGDWICSDPNCGNINFARRLSCYRCNKEKPESTKPFKKKLGTEIGKSAAEKSRGLFNADDWQCNKCANVNWARRQTCNVCNAPRFGEVEARTGYGGGYNERGVVEYRRRDSSSDDEYDEFGRKKRKRRSEPQEKVGITEGAAFNKLLPTILQMDPKQEHVIPVPATNVQYTNKEKTKGSLSDGSVCDVAPLTKVNFRRYQLQNQTNYHRQDHMLPGYKLNGLQARIRIPSSGEKDATASSGYETASKRSKRDSSGSPAKAFNPVMENRVSSTNHDFVYKFTGPTPAENFQVTYTLEERVRAAACAIVYNNCKISTDKFQAMFDKPAPDFKTIFGWRQQLLTTGCLVDSHREEKSAALVIEKTTTSNTQSTKVINKLPSPDEIPIVSDSDDENPKTVEIQNKSLPPSIQRSVSVETLVISGVEENRPTGSSSTATDGSRQHVRSQSETTNRQTHSSSHDSRDSTYSNTDSEPDKSSNKSKPVVNNKNNYPLQIHSQSVHDSDSESISYHSEEDNFLSRVYPDGKKVKRKTKKRIVPTVPVKPQSYIPEEKQSFMGYSTAKLCSRPPLATGNIYTPNLRNMNVKTHVNLNLENDGCASEYVPTKLGSTTKNYQEFKNNVRRKGYWAKGNGVTLHNKTIHNSSPIIDSLSKPLNRPRENFSTPNRGYMTNQPSFSTIRVEDFSQDNIDSFSSKQHYLPFDKSLPSVSSTVPEKLPENTSYVFEAVQSNSFSKNKSILDIFSMNDKESPEENGKDTEKNIALQKVPETHWDVDDDALYRNSDDEVVTDKKNCTQSSLNKIRVESPISNMLYATDAETPTENKSKSLSPELIKNKHDMLLGFLKDVKSVNEKESLEHINQQAVGHVETFPKNEQVEKRNVSQKQYSLIMEPDPIPLELSNDIMRLSEDHFDNISPENSLTITPPSKKVHVLESITIVPSSNQNQISLDNVATSQDTIKYSNSTNNSNVNNYTQDLQRPNEDLTDSTVISQSESTLDLSNLLSGINTNTLLLALQNLQKMNNASTAETIVQDLEGNTMNSISNEERVETINLTNDEDWEKESNDGSIERQLQKLDGDTPFLSDIFDPGPVVLPNANKFNINLKNTDGEKTDPQKLHLNDNAPVIGNFKSFALPKPVLLNRLKLTVKPSDRNTKMCTNGMKKRKRKSKVPSQNAEGGEEEEDEEESGDEADLSKYDLWGSDAEGNTSKAEIADKSKEGETSKEAQDTEEKNGDTVSPEVNSTKRKRSRSSSSSSSSSTSSSSSQSSTNAPKNKFDDFNLNSEKETSPKGRQKSRSPRRPAAVPSRRKSRDSRSAGETRGHEKEWSRDRERRDRSRGNRDERKERRYSREGGNHYGGSVRGRHR